MTIAEVSEKYGLTADTLRYYERVGLLPPVPRTSGGIRDYGEKDCGWIEFIKCMRGAGLPVEVLIDYVQLFQQGSADEDEQQAHHDGANNPPLEYLGLQCTLHPEDREDHDKDKQVVH